MRQLPRWPAIAWLIGALIATAGIVTFLIAPTAEGELLFATSSPWELSLPGAWWTPVQASGVLIMVIGAAIVAVTGGLALRRYRPLRASTSRGGTILAVVLLGCGLVGMLLAPTIFVPSFGAPVTPTTLVITWGFTRTMCFALSVVAGLALVLVAVAGRRPTAPRS